MPHRGPRWRHGDEPAADPRGHAWQARAREHGWRQSERWHRREPPPWWPEGEPWPPERPPWHAVPRRFRRRFLLGALIFVAACAAFVFLASLAIHGGDDRFSPPDRPRPAEDERRPGVLLGVIGIVVVVGGGATWLAYRRISRPVGELLGAAEKVATGDYRVAVEPDGPASLRRLTARFNDMAGRLATDEDQRRRFLADVTHELRTPLAVLQTGLEAQLDGVHPRDDRHLGSLLEEVQRLGHLVDDLHTLALAEAGRIELHREPVAPATLAEDAVAAHAPMAARKQVRLRTEAPTDADLPEVEVDASRIRQVLDNLLANAIRHTPPGGEVVVHIEPLAPAGSGAAQVQFTVTDAGPGFVPDQLDHIFDRFTRAGDSRGSGLGLSIARDLVQAHGGSIHATNHPTTGGATVTFTV